jgi:hypothetical protein
MGGGGEVWGCMDPSAVNYCGSCNMDDDSCNYGMGSASQGCADINAMNWNAMASIDDGSCCHNDPDVLPDSANYASFSPCPNGPEYDGPISCGEMVTGNTGGAMNNVGNTAGDHLYTFTLSQPETVEFDTCGSNFDTYARIYTPDLMSQLAECDDCGGCGSQAVLVANLAAGNYVFVLDGYDASEGGYQINMVCGAGADGQPAAGSNPCFVCEQNCGGNDACIESCFQSGGPCADADPCFECEESCGGDSACLQMCFHPGQPCNSGGSGGGGGGGQECPDDTLTQSVDTLTVGGEVYRLLDATTDDVDRTGADGSCQSSASAFRLAGRLPRARMKSSMTSSQCMNGAHMGSVSTTAAAGTLHTKDQTQAPKTVRRATSLRKVRTAG